MNTLGIRATLAFLVLPGTVAFAVPVLLARSAGTPFVLSPASALPLLAGSALLLGCVIEFYRTGRGTLAPWDPPRTLVARGPYRYSRNPMYVAVLLILAGWALGFGSTAHVIYAGAVALAFHLRVILAEEPWLARTHGARWDEYRRRVPRWIGPAARR